MMSFTLKINNNIGIIEFDQKDSKVNLLTSEAIRQLDRLLDEAANNPQIKALVITSSKKNVFIAGADIKEIEEITDPQDGQAKSRAGQDVLNKLEDFNAVT